MNGLIQMIRIDRFSGKKGLMVNLQVCAANPYRPMISSRKVAL